MRHQAYLLKVEEQSGEDTFITHHLIRAENRQKVKYHYHRTLKDLGYTDSPDTTTHNLERDWGSLRADIYNIERLDRKEYDIMSDYITDWVKV